MAKSPEAFRTISEVAELLETPAHVLRFWESRFTQIKPVKRAGGRRYYRPADVALLGGIRKLLHDDGITIRGVQKLLREQGVQHVSRMVAIPLSGPSAAPAYEIETATIETAAITAVEHPAPQQDTGYPVAETGFALESFVAKHGGKGLPLQGQDTSAARPVVGEASDRHVEDATPTTADSAAESSEQPLAEDHPASPPLAEGGILSDVPNRATVAAERHPDARSTAADGLFPPAANAAPPHPATVASAAPARIAQRGQTPEDAVAMVDTASLPRMGAGLRRTRPAALEAAKPQLAVIYERMRALRLRLAQDVGTARR